MAWQGYVTIFILIWCVGSIIGLRRTSPAERDQRARRWAKISLPLLVAWFLVTLTMFY